MVGRIHLYLNGKELRVENLIPDNFDVSDTVKLMFEMSRGFERTGSVSVTPFCCICGDRSCAYIRWHLETEDSETKLIMEDLLGNPIGAHQYRLQRETLFSAIAALARSLVIKMKEEDVRETTTGTIQEFTDWHEHLANGEEPDRTDM